MADFDINITATYSPEDNKIRLYASERLDAETFQRVKAAGFKWAPKQELFVAPMWTVARENLALELAGEIEPEETTMAERAQIKADRLDGIAQKRAEQANAFHRAADELSRAFEFGQPILVGHHSERKARKTQERMHNAMDKAVKAHGAIGYWQYRAAGVERHANRKNDPKVRARRNKKLLAELRDLMQSCGYVSPEKKPAKPPILNFKAQSGKFLVRNPWNRTVEFVPQVEMTKAEFAKIGTDYRGTRLSACGAFRVRIAPNPNHEGPRFSAGWAAILITDQKQHDAPADFDEEIAQ